MNTWHAPLIVAILSIIAATLVNEPAAAIFGIGVALCGYAINKADNRDV